jgi:two-component system OmpR family sensor kinase
MSLRTRVLLVFLLIGLTIVSGAVLTAHVQRAHLVDQVDDRISRLADAPKFIEKRALANRIDKPAGAGLSDTYLGYIDTEGDPLQTLSTPDDNPEFVPDIRGLTPDQPPATVRTLAGKASPARATLVSLGSGAMGVVAISLEAADRATSQLRTTLVFVVLGILFALALLAWWILRLGIRPMRELTTAATEVARGHSPDVSSVDEPSREASELKAAVNDLISTAKSNEARMRQFVQDASHELRTPLTTLRGYASHASGDPQNTAVVADALTRIGEESMRMSRLVDDLLTLARSDERDQLITAEVDLTAVITDVAADLRVAQPDRELLVSAAESVLVAADRALITQAILALASNALRHTPTGATVTMTVTASTDEARVSVHDNGPGIDPEHQPHLFDRFYRGASTRPGTGLGLAIFASIIERHSGTYGVDSSPGAGTTFWFSVPRDRGID